VAVVLGAAKAAALNKDKIPGNIVFIFQPAEEKLSGAEKMLDAGILDHYSIDAVFGFHNWPELPTDKIGLKKGAIMAAVDKFEVELIGRGSHGSEPHKSADPIIMLNSFITQLQTIVSRKINPLEPAVVSIGKIEAGTAFNIIPDKVRLEGTVRSFSKNISSQVEREMENILKSAAYQGSYQLDYKRLIPPTVNDNKMTEMLYDLINADQNLPEAVYIDKASTVGEDFSLFLENIPGSYFFLGSKKGKEAKLHDAEYDVNEKILLPGVKVIMAVIKAYFSRD